MIDTKTLIKIKSKWMKYAPEQWWGDHIDVRFYLISKLKAIVNKRILDVGCNAGILLSEIPENNEKHGIDIDVNLVKKAKSLNKRANLILASMFYLPYKDNSFDVVICAHVVPYADFSVPEGKEKELQNKMIREVHRVLKKDGMLLLTTPNKAYYKAPTKMSYEDLKKLLEPYFDFKIFGWNPFPSFPYFLPTRVLMKIPRILQILGFLMDKKILLRKSKSFFIVAKKNASIS